jgi:hypothetical protein
MMLAANRRHPKRQRGGSAVPNETRPRTRRAPPNERRPDDAMNVSLLQ